MQSRAVGAFVEQVSKEDYDNFFKMTFREFIEPLGVSHFSAEGTTEFTAMLFVPGMAPFEQTVRPPLPNVAYKHTHIALVLVVLVVGDAPTLENPICPAPLGS